MLRHQRRHKICFINSVSARKACRSLTPKISRLTSHAGFQFLWRRRLVICLSFNDSFVRTLIFAELILLGKIKSLS